MSAAPNAGHSMPTTRQRTLRLGPEGPGGWRDLVTAEGDSVAGDPAGELKALKPLATIAHLSDIHICDAESPVRLEYLDHLADPGMPYADIFEEIGTYRPNEILTAHVATAMVQRLNDLTVGPLAGQPIDDADAIT